MPEVADRLVFAVANGASLTRAAAEAGIGLRTLRDWIERGRAEPYGQLVARLDVARAERAATARPWPELLAQLHDLQSLDDVLRDFGKGVDPLA
jgi:hypothetical protein